MSLRVGGALLVICTANVCRSPLAAAILAERLLPVGVVDRVGSAGVCGLYAAPMCPVSAEDLTNGQWLATVGHRSRSLTAELVADADLVLALERAHRSAAVRLLPGSQAKVFTLREAETLLGVLRERATDPLDGLAALACAMHAVRGMAVPTAPAARRWWQRPEVPVDPLDIADGHGRADLEHRRAVATVRATAESVADAMTALSR